MTTKTNQHIQQAIKEAQAATKKSLDNIMAMYDNEDAPEGKRMVHKALIKTANDMGFRWAKTETSLRNKLFFWRTIGIAGIVFGILQVFWR